MSANAQVPRHGPVLLFDGSCGLCNRAVRLLLRLDRRGTLRFAALQGAPAQAWLGAHALPSRDFDSLVFVRDWQGSGTGGADDYALRTDGLIAALQACGGLGPVLAWIRFIPRAWRDGAYRWVARERYRVFGEWRDRPLSRPEMSERFIADPSS